MTCIVGYIYKNEVWIGGDSMSSNSSIEICQKQPKVFRSLNNPHIIIGATNSWRHVDILRYSKELFANNGKEVDHKYMVTEFVPTLIELINAGIPKKDERATSILVGAYDRLFEVQGDYSVLEHVTPYCAIGCGQEVAMGSLLSTDERFSGIKSRQNVRDKICLALRASAFYNAGVGGALTVISTKD